MSEEDLDNTPLTLEEQLRFARAIEASPRKIAEIEQRIRERDAIKTTGKAHIAVYVHGDQDGMYDRGKKLGLTGDALDQFCYLAYEVTLTYEVDMKTGLGKIIAVDGRAVSEGISS